MDLPATATPLIGREARARRACEQAAAAGAAVWYRRAIWVPGESRVMYLFQAQDAAVVETVCQAAQIPFLRVVDAVDMSVR